MDLSRGFFIFMNLAERLKELRLEQKWKQEEAADQLGLSMSAYCRYELGKREPTASVLERIADAYGVSTDFLLGRTDRRESPPR